MNLPDETHYRILKRIEADPDISQRQLAQELGVSVGKINYCLHALVDKGWVKINNFKKNPNKLAYAYILTPKGVVQKAHLTMGFLQRKMAEYETIQAEIKELQSELNSISGLDK